MVTSAATFAFFMSSQSSLAYRTRQPSNPVDTILVGTVIRTDGLTMSEWANQQLDNPTTSLLVPRHTTLGGTGQSAFKQEWERRKSQN